MKNKYLEKKIKEIPHSPGCYRYFNDKGELIYIGKAKDLKKRVYSYFVGLNDPKTAVLVENIADIKWETTESEIEALILESLLIKKYKPKFNIKVKDDKDFLWIKIDMGQDFPMPELVRRPEMNIKKRSIRYFGPYTDSRLLKEGLSILRKIFLWRDCSAIKFNFYQKKGKPCLEYYIKNCSAPCMINNNHSQSETIINKQSLLNKNDYQLAIKQFILFLRGGKMKIIKDLESKMKKSSKKKDFEKAAYYRDRLRSLQHIDKSFKMRDVEKQEKTKDLEKFIDRINIDLGYNLPAKKDFRIEFYDISNTSGSESVGSMVVSVGGGFARGEYRKFKVRTVKGPNDVKMLREILQRRLQKIFNFQFSISNQFSMTNEKKDISFSKKPDLIVLDGGKPQLGEIGRLFAQLKIDIPLLSLAKEEEEVFGLVGGKFKKTSIRKNSPEGFFIQVLRDEAHRFAITFHKKLRSKGLIRSRLDDIEGIGPITKKKLLTKFGSVEGIKKASVLEVADVAGKKLAHRIKEML